MEELPEDIVIDLAIKNFLSIDTRNIINILFQTDNSSIIELDGLELTFYHEKIQLLGKRRYQITGDDEVDILLKLKVGIYEQKTDISESINIYIPIEAKATRGDIKKGIGQAKLFQELFGLCFLLIPSNMRSFNLRKQRYKKIMSRENIGLLIFDVEEKTIKPVIQPKIDAVVLNIVKKGSMLFEFYDRFLSFNRIIKAPKEQFNRLVNTLERRNYVLSRTDIRSILERNVERSIFSTFCLCSVSIEKIRLPDLVRTILKQNRDFKRTLFLFLSIDSSFLNELFSYVFNGKVTNIHKAERLLRVLQIEIGELQNLIKAFMNDLLREL